MERMGEVVSTSEVTVLSSLISALKSLNRAFPVKFISENK